MAENDTDLIWVKSTRPSEPDGGDKVILGESDPRHPNDGWAMIAGPKPVQVARTPEVERVLREGTAVEDSAPAPASGSQASKRAQSSAADQSASTTGAASGT